MEMNNINIEIPFHSVCTAEAPKPLLKRLNQSGDARVTCCHKIRMRVINVCVTEYLLVRE